jgi:hypothetical protein
MKKIIALTVVAILTIALCISASAQHSFDRLYVNENTLTAGDGLPKTSVDEDTGLVHFDVEIQPGDKMYMLGWVVDLEGESTVSEVYYTIDGAVKACDANYRDRGDVAQYLGVDAALGANAGIGHDDNAFEFTGIDQLTDGTYVMTVVAKFVSGSEEQLAEINLKVGTGVKPEQPATEGTIRDFAKDKGDAMSYDAIYVNGEKVAEQNDPVIAYKKLIDGSDGHITSVGMYGWYGNSSAKIVSFGYMIDGNEPVFGDFKFEPTEDAVIQAGGESRYLITIDVTGLKDGKDHKIQAVAKMDNGDIVKLNRFEGEKDRDAYVNYRAQLVEDQNPPTPVTGDATVALTSIVAVISLAAVVVFRKRVF